MTAFSNREAWLLAAVQLLKPIFAAKRHIVPDDCQVSCGFARPERAVTTSGSAGHAAAAPMKEIKSSFPQPWEVLSMFRQST